MSNSQNTEQKHLKSCSYIEFKYETMIKKTILLAALAIGILLCSVSYRQSTHRLSAGQEAPAFTLEENHNNLSLSSLRGEYVILNFWTSEDAPSREMTNLYTAWERSHPEINVKLLAINFDDSQAMFNEIVRRDNLNPSEQHYVSGNTAEAIENAYGLKKGFGSLLIDPQGNIIMRNPTTEQLSEMFC